MVDRVKERETRSQFGASKMLLCFVVLFLTGLITFVAGPAIIYFSGNPSGTTGVILLMYGMIALGISVSESSGRPDARIREYFQRNVWGYNACIYTYGENNLGVLALRRGSETYGHITAHNPTEYLVIPLGGWFAGRPRIQYGFGGDVATVYDLKLKEDKRHPFHVWVKDKEGAQLSFGPMSLMKFVGRIRQVSYSRTWRDALQLLHDHHDQLASQADELSKWKRQYEGSLASAYFMVDAWIGLIDSSDRLPFTKEGQELRELMVHYRLSTLPEGDPRRAVLETPPRRRTRAKDKKSKIVAEFS